jgi:hypothetical protein
VAGQAREIFVLPLSQPLGAWGHATALVEAQAQASWELRRGFRLGAEAEAKFMAGVEAQVGAALAASLKAGVGARAAAVLQAQLPLDLFDEAGLFARAELNLQAAAFASVQLSMTIAELRRGLIGELPGLGGEVVDIVLDEFKLSAGLWARASFSVELMAEAILAANLLGDRPGMTFSLEAGAGLGLGGGVQFLANVGFVDPDRLVGRLSDRVTASVLEAVPHTGSAGSARARAALQVLVPGLMRASFTAGRMLATANQETTARQYTQAAMARALIANCLDVLVRAGTDLAFSLLQQTLRDAGLADAFAAVRDPEHAAAALSAFEQALAAVDRAAGRQDGDWFAAILDIVAAIEELLTLDGLPVSLVEDASDLLATIWAAGALLERVVQPPRDPSQVTGTPIYGAVPHEPGQRLREIYGGELTYGRLAGYLSRNLDPWLAGAPELAPALAFVRELTGADQNVVGFLVDLATQPPERVAADLLSRLSRVLETTVQRDILPWLDDAMKRAHPADEVQLFVANFVRPLLVGLPPVLLPALQDLGSAGARRRSREAISAALLTVIGPAVVSTTRVVLEHAARNGAASLQALAADVKQHGEQAAGYRQLAVAAQGGLARPAELAGLLAGVSEVLPAFAGGAIAPLIAAAADSMHAGVGDPATAKAAADTLLRSDAASDQAALQKTIDESFGRALAVAGKMFADFVEDVASWLQDAIVFVGNAIAAGAAAVFKALEQGIEWAGRSAAELLRRAQELLAAAQLAISQLLASVATIAERLRNRVGLFFDELKRAVDEWIRAVFPDWISSWLAPVVVGLIGGMGEIVECLFDVAANVADSLSQRLRAAAERGQMTEGGVWDHVTASTFDGSRRDVHLDVKPAWSPWGVPVTIDGGQIAGAALHALRTDGSTQSHVRGAARNIVDYRANMTAKQQVDAAREQEIAKAQMAKEVAALKTGRPLSVRIEAPAGGNAPQASYAPVVIRLSGANRSFVNPAGAFGLPARVRILLNDVPVAFTSAEWLDEGQDLVYRGRLVAVEPVVAPLRSARRLAGREVRVEGPAEARRALGPAADVDLGEVKVTVTVIERARSRDSALGEVEPFARPAAGVSGRAAAPAPAWQPHLPARPGINTLAVAVADGAGKVAHATRVFMMQAPDLDRPPVRIEAVTYPGKAAREHIVLRNVGARAVDLTGWALRDPARHILPLPGRTLRPGDALRMHSGRGRDSATDAFAGRTGGVWNDRGDTVFLTDRDGRVVDELTYVP